MKTFSVKHKAPNKKTTSPGKRRDSTGRAPTAPNEAQQREQANLVFRLRVKGFTYREIGAKTGLAPATVYRIVHAELEATPVENREEVRKLENERLDILLSTWMPTAETDIESAKMVLKNIDMRCRINGVYAPTQIEDVTPPAEAREALLERLARELKAASTK